MWIHWSVTRLVRWRVRDWASCFTACRFPLGKPKKIKMNINLKYIYILKREYILYQFDMWAWILQMTKRIRHVNLHRLKFTTRRIRRATGVAKICYGETDGTREDVRQQTWRVHHQHRAGTITIVFQQKTRVVLIMTQAGRVLLTKIT